MIQEIDIKDTGDSLYSEFKALYSSSFPVFE